MKNPFHRLFSRRSKRDDAPQNLADAALRASRPSVLDEDDSDAERSAVERLRRQRANDSVGHLLSALGTPEAAYKRSETLRQVFQRSLADFGVSGEQQTRPAAAEPLAVGENHANGGASASSDASSAAAPRRAMAQDAAMAGAPLGSKSGISARSRSSMFANHATIDDRVLQHFHNRGFIGWQACAVLAQHEVINRACAIPAEDAIAHGYKLVCASREHDYNQCHDADEARWLYDIKALSDEMGMNDICIQLNYKKKVFGVGLAIPRVRGADYERPFNIDGIKADSYEGFAIVDPYWLTYEFDDGSQSDPTSPSFYDPTFYRMPDGRRVHKSWIVRCVNAHVPDVLKPTYYFGGVPLPQMIYERVFCADKIANEAPLLAMTKRLLIADANVEELYKDSAYASRMMKAINYFRDNFSIFFKKPSSQVQQIDTTLSEFDQLIMTQYQLVACIAQMPATKLLKVTPTGFQSTGEYEWKDYAQSLIDIQQNDYSPLLQRHYQMLLRSIYPERKDLAVKVVFSPIDVPTKEQNATTETRIAQLCSTLIQTGVITPDEARRLLRTEDQGMFTFLDPVMPQILQNMMDAKDPANQQQPGGGMGGMGGAMPQGGMPQMGGAMGGDPNAAQGGGGGNGAADPNQDPNNPYGDAAGQRNKEDFTNAVLEALKVASPDNPALKEMGVKKDADGNIVPLDEGEGGTNAESGDDGEGEGGETASEPASGASQEVEPKEEPSAEPEAENGDEGNREGNGEGNGGADDEKFANGEDEGKEQEQ